MIIAAADGLPVTTADELVLLAQATFPEATRTPSVAPRPGVAFQLDVAPQAEPPFSLIAFDDGQLSCDGTAAQCEQFAVALRAALPAESGRVVALSDDGARYVDLAYGITIEGVRDGWRLVSDSAFS